MFNNGQLSGVVIAEILQVAEELGSLGRFNWVVRSYEVYRISNTPNYTSIIFASYLSSGMSLISPLIRMEEHLCRIRSGAPFITSK